MHQGYFPSRRFAQRLEGWERISHWLVAQGPGGQHDAELSTTGLAGTTKCVMGHICHSAVLARPARELHHDSSLPELPPLLTALATSPWQHDCLAKPPKPLALTRCRGTAGSSCCTTSLVWRCPSAQMWLAQPLQGQIALFTKPALISTSNLKIPKPSALHNLTIWHVQSLAHPRHQNRHLSTWRYSGCATGWHSRQHSDQNGASLADSSRLSAGPCAASGCNCCRARNSASTHV